MTPNMTMARHMLNEIKIDDKIGSTGAGDIIDMHIKPPCHNNSVQQWIKIH